MSIKLSGLDALQRQLGEVQRALQQLNGTVGTLSFDPKDAGSVRQAILQMERLVDAKVAPYKANPLVSQISSSVKAQYKKSILERVRQA
jgi:hypothetical protein